MIHTCWHPLFRLSINLENMKRENNLRNGGNELDIIKRAAEALENKGYKVIFTECLDERIIKAARYLYEHGICMPILLGEPDEIRKVADKLEINLANISICDMSDDALRNRLAAEYHQTVPMYSEKVLLRKMKNPLNMAAMMVKVGLADCLAAGVTCATGDVILTAQQFIGLKEGIKTVSSIGFQVAPQFSGQEGLRLLGLSDCAVCANPTIEELAGIAVTSADSYHNITGEVPRVAMLSYSTLGSTEGASVNFVRSAMSLAKQMRPDLLIDGEFQIDTAIVPAIAERKAKEVSEVAGKANVLIFPNLDAGNIAVKCMQIFGNLNAFGPILQGFEKPVTDFSRAAKVDDIVGNISLCLLQKGV